MTALTESSLEGRIKAEFEDATFVKAFDISGGCGASFEVVIVSPSFEGMSTLKRHRLVNTKLKDEIAALHAFTQKTYTPKQFENVRIEGVAPPANTATADQPADPALAPP